MAKISAFHRPYDAAGPGPRKRLYEVGEELADQHDFTIYGRKRRGLELWLKYRKGGTIPYEVRDNLVNRLRLQRILPETDVVIVNRDFCGRFDSNLANIVSESDAGFVYDVDDLMWGGDLQDHYMKYLEAADVVTVSSDYLKHEASDLADRVVKVPTACDTERFGFRSPSKGNIEISWVNRFPKMHLPEVYYEVRDAIATLEEEYNLTFRLVGHIPENVRDVFSSLNSVIFMGFIPYEEVPEVLGETDIGLVPLNRKQFDKAKSPTKLFEYLASGAVPVATSVGETTISIEDGQSGFLVEREESWESVLRRAIESDLSEMAHKGRRRVENRYSLNVAAERYNQIIQDLSK